MVNFCDTLRNGFILCNAKNLYNVQRIVFVNKDDLEDYNIVASSNRNSISFKLKDGKRGFLFQYNGGEVVSSSFSKTNNRGVSYYRNSISAYIQGVEEKELSVLKQLDKSNYFGAVLFNSGDVWIYGFEYGLKLNDYTYTTESDITLESNVTENYPPLIYISLNPKNDFDNLFGDNNDVVRLGDFNNDFNNDFY